MSEALMQKARRETLRWLLLFVLEKCIREVGANEAQLRYMIAGAEGLQDVRQSEIRTELQYLYERELIHLEYGDHVPHWRAKLTRAGIDVAQHAVPCEAGIARPPKDWAA